VKGGAASDGNDERSSARVTSANTSARERRSANSRRAALLRWSRSDGRAGTEAKRAAFMRSFEDRVDPDRVLDPEERERRAARLRRVHMADLARLRWQKARER
jgi:hypothetical protein